MEKKIIIGKLEEIYSKKKDTTYYAVNYLDDAGISHKDFITKEEYENILGKNPKINTNVIGIYAINDYRKIYLKDIK